MSLDELRAEIDAIDDEIAPLLARRMGISAQVAMIKRETGGAILQPEREKAILARLGAGVEEQYRPALAIIYEAVFRASREYQRGLLAAPGDSPLRQEFEEAAALGAGGFPENAVVACQGIEGAYSHLAALRIFREPEVQFLRTFDAVFRAVVLGQCRYGVLPIENSSFGSVTPVFDLLKRHRCKIVRAARLPIAHCLLSRAEALEDIKEIYTHEQALGQCGKFLEKLSPWTTLTVCENTAVAARMVAESDRADTAAISSEECAALYGLRVLKRGIQNEARNETRFICIARQAEIYPGANKSSVLLTLQHRPGSLARLLQLVSAAGINLTKLETRPVPGRNFEFLFYLDMECDASQPASAGFLEEIARQSEDFFFLGSYTER